MKATDEEYLDHLDLSIKERGRGGWQEEVTNEFKRCGWRFLYHVWDSRKSPGGFPDLLIVGAVRPIVIELKAGRNKLRNDQVAWLNSFRDSGALTFALWPRHRQVMQLIASGNWSVADLQKTGRLHVYTRK